MEIEEIRKKLEDKDYSQETKDYIIQYINLNKELYGHILNVDEQFLDRITANLKGNITTVDFKNNSFKKEIGRLSKMITRKIGAMYDKREQKVFINPIRKLQSKLFKKDSSMMLTRIMHELDHIATAATFEDENGEKKTVLGIADMSENIDLSLLNEGITAYKEEAYAKKLGSEYHSSYKDEKKVAEFIANIIGKENLIKYHFNNDYVSIKNSFYEKTGVDLDTVVKVLNEESKTGKRRNPLKKIFKKKILKLMKC